jgi:mono/diheme cytochrome c family protein
MRLTCALLSVTMAALLPQAASAASAANGEKMAKRWCAACHVVAKDQKSGGSTQSPPFSAIANKPGFDASKLALYLLLPHPRMPDMNMSRAEAEDLAAYIADQGR